VVFSPALGFAGDVSIDISTGDAAPTDVADASISTIIKHNINNLYPRFIV
jgi:hypothetical protein